MFLRIENPVTVIPSVELLRTLGASSARGDDNKIGQFGSGFPNSLALLARKGLLNSLKICLGKEVYTFSTKASKVKTSANDDFIIDEIVMKKQNGGLTNLNISTEFGAIDWTDTGMALREFVSNAIDGTVEQGLSPYKTVIEIVEDNQCRSKDGTVRVYIPINDEVNRYYNNLHEIFICLNRLYDSNKKVLTNYDGDKAKFYRKGVLVGSFGVRSLFDYNSEDIKLNESRTIDYYHARSIATKLIRDGNVDTIVAFIQSFDKGNEYYEHDLYSGDFDPKYEYNEKEIIARWEEAYCRVYGDGILCRDAMIGDMVSKKGYHAIVLNNKLFDILDIIFKESKSVRDAAKVLTKDECDGKSVHPATNDVHTTLDKVWSIVEQHQLTNGRHKPSVHCFSEVTKAEGNRLGYYRFDDKTIYILSDIANHCFMLTQTMVEEVAHHVTGAKDCTREFQDFAFRLATLMIH
jgi:hypothetical protein